MDKILRDFEKQLNERERFNETQQSSNTNIKREYDITYEPYPIDSCSIYSYSTDSFDKIRINNKKKQLDMHIQKSKYYKKIFDNILDDYNKVIQGGKTDNYDIFKHYDVVKRYRVLLTIIKHYPRDLTNKLKNHKSNKIVDEIYEFIKEKSQRDNIFDNSVIVLNLLITMTLEAEKILDSIDYYDNNELTNIMSEVERILDSINQT